MVQNKFQGRQVRGQIMKELSTHTRHWDVVLHVLGGHRDCDQEHNMICLTFFKSSSLLLSLPFSSILKWFSPKAIRQG